LMRIINRVPLLLEERARIALHPFWAESHESPHSLTLLYLSLSGLSRCVLGVPFTMWQAEPAACFGFETGQPRA
jgi:hypothetical protein